MPIVVVVMWEARTVTQKRGLTRAITDATVPHAGAAADGLHAVVQEYPRENWARARVLGVDRRDG
jgi:4-oxalocrotonate tautomerase